MTHREGLGRTARKHQEEHFGTKRNDVLRQSLGIGG